MLRGLGSLGRALLASGLQRAASGTVLYQRRGQSEFNAVYRNLADFDEDKIVVKQPAALAVELLPFQLEGVGWMMRRELKSHGGIMADHLGMGKTVQMIALCLAAKEFKELQSKGGGGELKEALEHDTRAAREALAYRIITVARQLQKVPAIGNCSKITQPGKDLLRIIVETEDALERGDATFDQGIADLKPWLQLAWRLYPSFARRIEYFLEDKQAKTVDEVETPELRTLVVVPASLLYQWAGELREKVNGDQKMSVYILHNKMSQNLTTEQLDSYDFVVTTYDTVTRCASPAMSSKTNAKSRGSNVELHFNRDAAHPLFHVRWKRIILDEAHVIRNINTTRGFAVSQLEGVKKWCVTATPFHNSILDLQSLMKFSGSAGLPLPGGSAAAVTRSLLMDQTLQRAVARAISPVVLRRTPVMKRGGEELTLVRLPPKHEYVDTVKLTDREAIAYNEVLVRFKAQATQASGFLLAMRLRQACLHPWLLRSTSTQSYLCSSCRSAASEPIVAKCGHAYCYECLKQRFSELSVDAPAVRVPCVECEQPIPVTVFNNATGRSRLRDFINRRWEPSTKINHVLEIVRQTQERHPGEKIVIFSQFTSFLDVLGIGLSNAGVDTVRVDGTMPVGHRAAVIKRFTTQNVPVMLASKMATGVGLNLTAANHVIVTDPWWNPAIEEQAVHRCHRIGQKRPVHIHRLSTAGTIEEYCINVAAKKKKFGDAVLAIASDEAEEWETSLSSIMSEVKEKLELLPLQRNAALGGSGTGTGSNEQHAHPV